MPLRNRPHDDTSLMVPIVIAAVVILAVLWASMLLLVWLRQERVVFRPPRVQTGDVTATRVEFASDDGLPLFAYVFGEPAPDRPNVIAFHGNADIARWFADWGAELARRTGGMVMIAEYRGYDGIPGPATCSGVEMDARAAAAWAARHAGESRGRTIYFGHSLGAAIAADLAAHEPPDALVLQSPFSSARAMARRMFFPGVTLMWPRFSRVHYDNVRRVRELDRPVHVAHGNRDIVVPVAMGEEVFAAARSRGRLLIVDGAGHSDVDDVGGERYWEWLVEACGVEARRPVRETRAHPAPGR